MPPDGEAAAELAADELQSLSFGSSSDRSRSRSASTVSTATASCSTSSSGPLHLPLPPRSTGNPSAAASAQAAVVPRLGSVSLSDIRFLRRLGAGDIGSVYLAEVRPKDKHPPSGGAAVLVAAKVMDRKELEGRNKEGRARTEREILEAVDHPFLPRLYGVAEGDRWSCLLTEFCPGGDLHVLRQRQPHRRFSEAAVSFPSSNSSSSGLDLEFVAEPVELRSMSFVGTHEYLAPEIVSGEGHGSSVDWWTLGVFIFELLYGVTPFKGYDNEMTLANIVARALEFPKEPSVSSAAKDLVTALLAKDPARRLGATVGAAAIKRHPFFNGVNWALLRCATPPYVPPPFTVANANKAGGNNGNDEDVSDDDSCPGTPVEYY
ncbi:hypothetical protein HU200_030839 [Digitaria exilis]|uniref:non-specific serine/threonine protein kinase n=1 Tax=Digitaria exilis TaxID=1010633 RepID=A0A835ES34_9POAL|nr:hypothetical protein HU200_030839 [Digitaria exilis]